MERYPNFAWWQGVVEDRNDPEKFGRYRVRIIGYHTLDKAILPTESLPWAIPMQSVTSAAISGVGVSPTGLVEGSAVIGFFVGLVCFIFSAICIILLPSLIMTRLFLSINTKISLPLPFSFTL